MEFVLGLVGLVILLIILNLLAGIGFIVRKGIETRKGLTRTTREARQKGHRINQQKYNELERSANLKIYGPILGVIVLYVVILILNGGLFLLSLLALIPMTLGYFGIFWKPSD